MIVKAYLCELFREIDNYLDEHGYDSVETITIKNLGESWVATFTKKDDLFEQIAQVVKDSLNESQL